MKYLSAAARNATKVANVSHIAYSMRIHFCLPNNGRWNERQEIHSLHIHNMNWYFWLVCFFFRLSFVARDTMSHLESIFIWLIWCDSIISISKHIYIQIHILTNNYVYSRATGKKMIKK